MFQIKTGDEFSGSLVLAGYPSSPMYGRGYILRCGCGELIVKYKQQIRRGGTSIMCRRCKCSAVMGNPKCKTNLTHGETGSYLYTTWDNMRRRCRGAWNSQRWKDKGVRVCPEWDASYEAFATYVRANLGERPDGYSLDRIKNDGDYEPGNIRWATDSEQMFNRSKGWKWVNRTKAPTAIDDPVWAERIGNLPETMHSRQLAAHLGITEDRLRGILGVLGKKCIRKRRRLSELDPLI